MSKWKFFMMFLIVLALLAMPLLACGGDDEEPVEEGVILTMAVEPADSGTTTPAIGAHEYDEGTVVDITAIPAEGWKFDKWLGLYVTDLNSATTTVPVGADMTVTATFVQVTSYTLTMEIAGDGTGSIEPAAGTHDFAKGTAVTITATPNNDSYFINWDGDVADPLADSTTVTMDAAKTVKANFGLLGGPEISIVKPSKNDMVAGTLAIQADVTDDLGVTSGEYCLDGGEYVAMTPEVTLPANTVTFTADWDSTMVSDGYHVIYVRATNGSGLSTTNTVAISVRNIEPQGWNYEVTFVNEQLTPVIGSNTEVTTWEMTVAGTEVLTTSYFSGDCLKLYIDYGEPGSYPLRFKQGMTTWLVSSSIWTDVVTGQMMKQEAEVLMPGDKTVTVAVTNEWIDESTYISHTVIVGLPIDVPDEFHQIEPAATPLQVVETAAGDFLCDVFEDHVLSDTGRMLTGFSLGTGDGTKTEFGPTPSTPIDAYSEVVYVAGVRQFRDLDYTISYEAGIVTFYTAPASDEAVTIDYNWIMKLAGETLWKVNYVDHVTPGYGLIKQIDYMYGGESTQVLMSIATSGT